MLREPHNSGPAGGWERALKVFSGSSMDLAWGSSTTTSSPGRRLSKTFSANATIRRRRLSCPGFDNRTGPSQERASRCVSAPRSIVEHRSGLRGVRDPAWKYYYEARNTIYVHLRLRKGRGPWPRAIVKLTLRAIWRAPERRWLRLKLIANGVVHGIAGRLGRRVNAEEFP